MPLMVVRLEPSLLSDPDADLRYEIPDLLAERSGGEISDEGYDYEPETNAMLIFLSAADLQEALVMVVSLLENDHLHGNELSKAAKGGVCEASASRAGKFTVVYPTGASGIISVESHA